jgi:UDP-glucose 4-epimerase
MRVLVAGATGFVASHLIPRLTEAGHEVIALGHDSARIPAGKGITPVEADLRRPLDSEALPGFDAVVHLAQANVPFPEGALSLFRVNTASTAELLAAAAARGAQRFVFASSGSVYGLGDDLVGEGDPLRAEDYYSATKRSGELLVDAYREQLGTVILRFFAPYGPGQRGRLVPGLVARVRAGERVLLGGGGRPRLTPIFVDDAVEVILRALAATGSQVLNVAGDEVVSIRDLAELIGAALGRDPVFVDAPNGAVGDLIGRNDRMRELLGEHRLVTLEEGVRRTVEAG